MSVLWKSWNLRKIHNHTKAWTTLATTLYKLVYVKPWTKAGSESELPSMVFVKVTSGASHPGIILRAAAIILASCWHVELDRAENQWSYKVDPPIQHPFWGIQATPGKVRLTSLVIPYLFLRNKEARRSRDKHRLGCPWEKDAFTPQARHGMMQDDIG